jgi:hypothetical protein
MKLNCLRVEIRPLEIGAGSPGRVELAIEAEDEKNKWGYSQAISIHHFESLFDRCMSAAANEIKRAIKRAEDTNDMR